MPALNLWTPALALLLLLCGSAFAQHDSGMPSTEDGLSHGESAERHADVPPAHAAEIEPAIPPDMTLDEVLDYAAGPPPEDFPNVVHDDRRYAFTLFDQLEYRVTADNTLDRLGWEAQGWIGRDFSKFWWKNEGEAVFEGVGEGGTELDLLYSRLITPFWNFQIGAQYAGAWTATDYNDRLSAVVALQGLAPYKFEFDNSLYISEKGDVTFAVEAEYDLRVTQRLVLQPRAELSFAFQDIPERDLGAGLTDVNLDLRLRYELKREFAPYIGVRYHSLVGETKNIAEAAGVDTEQAMFVTGVRFAF